MSEIYNTSYSMNMRYDGYSELELEFDGDPRELMILKDSLINGKHTDLFPGKAIVKCKHCGQWGARKCECKKCGAPID